MFHRPQLPREILLEEGGCVGADLASRDTPGPSGAVRESSQGTPLGLDITPPPTVGLQYDFGRPLSS